MTRRSKVSIAKKQSKRQAKKKAPRKKKKVPPAPKVDPVKELLDGVRKPPNEFVKYLVEKARSSRTEFNQMRAEYERAKAAVAGLSKQLSELQGRHNSYITDIEHWLDQEQNKG